MSQETRVTNYPDVLTDRPTHYRPGCHHGMAHRLVVAEALTDLGAGRGHHSHRLHRLFWCSIYNYLL